MWHDSQVDLMCGTTPRWISCAARLPDGSEVTQLTLCPMSRSGLPGGTSSSNSSRYSSEPPQLAELAGTDRSNMTRDIEPLLQDGSVERVRRGVYRRRINGAEDPRYLELPFEDAT